jgi:signal transduction histidine kinase
VKAPRSLRTRLTLAFALTALIGVGGAFGALAFLVEHAVWAPLDAGLQEEADTLARLVDLPHDRLLDTVRDFGAETDLGPGKFVRVASPEGRTIAQARRVPSPVGRRRPRSLAQMTTATVGSGDRSYRVVWTPTPGGGWVVVGVRVAGQARLVRRARIAIAGVGVALILLLLAASWTIATRAVTELDRLAGELETIQAGSLARRLSRRDTAEIDRLVSVLNSMLARLESAVQHLRRFTADAAHELRTPIAAVRAHLDVTLSRTTTLEEFRDGVVDAIGQADRLGRLADDLLTLSTVEAQGPSILSRSEEVHLDALVREVGEFLDPVAEEQHRTFSWEDIAPATVRGVPSLLKRVVLNLVDNAFRHTSGAVTVRLTGDTRARIEVSDEGPGIPAEEVPRVFERFRRGTTDAGESGAGLGLALVREIVVAHGGAVAVQSNAGGTTISVTLPLQSP